MQVVITKDVLTVYGVLRVGDVMRISADEAKVLIDLGVADVVTAAATSTSTRRKRNVSRYDNRRKCGNP